MATPTEIELYTQMEEHLKKAGECARRLSIARADRRWHAVAELLLRIEQTVNSIYTKRRIIS